MTSLDTDVVQRLLVFFAIDYPLIVSTIHMTQQYGVMPQCATLLLKLFEQMLASNGSMTMLYKHDKDMKKLPQQMRFGESNHIDSCFDAILAAIVECVDIYQLSEAQLIALHMLLQRKITLMRKEWYCQALLFARDKQPIPQYSKQFYLLVQKMIDMNVETTQLLKYNGVSKSSWLFKHVFVPHLQSDVFVNNPELSTFLVQYRELFVHLGEMKRDEFQIRMGGITDDTDIKNWFAERRSRENNFAANCSFTLSLRERMTFYQTKKPNCFPLQKQLTDMIFKSSSRVGMIRLCGMKQCHFCSKPKYCTKRKILWRCKRCKMVRYCSRLCQKKDWIAKHSRNCQYFQEHRDLCDFEIKCFDRLSIVKK